MESFLSEAKMGDDQHLKSKKMGADDFIYVNTMVMYEDFVNALTKFRADIKLDPAMMKRAADRLEWMETVDQLEWGEGNPLDDLNSATPSPPSPVRFRFIHAPRARTMWAIILEKLQVIRASIKRRFR